jgi:hypothetical protein
MIAVQLNIENVTASNSWIARFTDWHGLVYKLAGESAAVESESTEAWLERLSYLLEGYKHDIYNADETGLFCNVLLIEPWLSKESLVMAGKTLKTDLLFYFVLTVMEVTKKCRLLSESPQNRDVSRMYKNYPPNTT